MLRLIASLMVILLITQAAYANKEAQQKAQTKAASLVQTAPVKRGSLISFQSFIGTLYYSESSVVASQVAGLALKVNFETTDKIKKNKILVELDHEILDSKQHAVKASIKEIRLQLEKVNKDLRRYTKLLQQKNVSQQQFDEIYYNKTTLEQKLIALQAQLDSLNIERKQSLIRAPFNGFITKKEISRGEWVDKGGKIATLVNPDKIYVLFDIPVSFANNLTINQAIEVQINHKNYPASIEGLIIQGDSKTRTLPLKVRLDKGNSSLFAGLEAEIKLPRNNQSNSLLLPRDAVIKRFGQDVVFSIKDGKAKMIPVQVKLYKGSQVAVTAEGLNNQMHVITKGNERIFPDQAVMENNP
ncbi:MAG: efflux RND transporter periplasmic adaptor subunit [Pseudomonadota bacterium]